MRRRCHDLPPVRGLFKASPEDFVVEEVPAYLPDGEGEHLYLWVEKRGLTTQSLLEALSARLGVTTRELGAAGQKDRQAVTRQWVSAPVPTPQESLSGEGWSVLDVSRHGNKLRTGHLRGNRFWIRLRGAGGDLAAARASLERLSERGVPNYFGAQRFGRSGDNAIRARRMLAGEIRVRSRFQRRMLVSALQSELFNDWLDLRFDDGLLDTALEGDLLQVRGGRGLFWCDAPEVDTPRVEAGEVDPTGPIFGTRMRAARGIAADREAVVLTRADLSPADLAAGGRDAQGARRPARIPLEGARAEEEGGDLLLEFELPRGAYATVVLAELTGSG